MELFGRIIGSISREPIEKAKVTLYVGNEELAVRYSDNEGKFEHKEAAHYIGEEVTVKIEKDGYEPLESSTRIEGTKVLLGDIELVAHEIKLELCFKDELHDPLENVKVTLEIGGVKVGEGFTNKDGCFKLSLSPELERKSLSYKGEIADFETASGEVELKEKTSREITMIRSPVIVISGKVEDNAGKALVGARVSLIVGDRELAVLHSDNKGEFKHEEKGSQYAGQEVKYLAEKEGYVSAKGSAKVQETGIRLTIALSPVLPEVPDIEIELSFKDKSQNPLENVKITLEIGGVKVGEGFTNKDGCFKLSLSPELEGKSLSYKGEIADFMVASGEVELKEKTSREITMTKSPAIVISGKVEDNAGKALVGARVSLIAGDRELAVLHSDNKGEFEHEEKGGLDAGREVKYVAEKEGYASLEGSAKVQETGARLRIALNPTPPKGPDGGPKTNGKPPIIPIISGIIAVVLVIAIWWFWTQGTVKIDGFEATPNVIGLHEKSMLSWSTSNAETVTLDGGVVSKSGNRQVSPQASTDYTLVARKGNDKVERKIRVVVERPQGPVTIEYFEALPSIIGLHEKSTLSWSTSNAETVTLDGGAVSRSDNRQVSPKVSTDYTLVARKGNDEVERGIRVVVEKPMITSFKAEYETITPGESSDLSWNVNFAEKASIEFKSAISAGTIDVNPKSGTYTVLPTQTTDYILKAISDDQTATKQIRIVVKEQPRIERFDADPTEVFRGGSSNLSWVVWNAEKVAIEPTPANRIETPIGMSSLGHSDYGISGRAKVTPENNVTYTLTAWNEGKLASRKALAKVSKRVTIRIKQFRILVPINITPIIARSLNP